jgi:hypothetical protein
VRNGRSLVTVLHWFTLRGPPINYKTIYDKLMKCEMELKLIEVMKILKISLFSLEKVHFMRLLSFLTFHLRNFKFHKIYFSQDLNPMDPCSFRVKCARAFALAFLLCTYEH